MKRISKLIPVLLVFLGCAKEPSRHLLDDGEDAEAYGAERRRRMNVTVDVDRSGSVTQEEISVRSLTRTYILADC